MLLAGATPDPSKLAWVHASLATLDALLGVNTFACAGHVTIADHALAASVESIRHSGVYCIYMLASICVISKFVN